MKTGGVLAPGSYAVTLFSGALAFHDRANLLDGDGDFNDNEVGDNYTANFNVATPAVDTRVVYLPDFSRPRPGRGRPGHRFDSADQDRHRDQRQGGRRRCAVQPDALEHHRGGAGQRPARSRWLGDHLELHQYRRHASAVEDDGFGYRVAQRLERRADPADLERPAGVLYESSQVLRLQNLRVNEDLIPSLADNAIHKVVYVGDADGDGAYGGTDAGLISRVVVNIDSGFDAHDWTDPLIVGDASGDGTLSGLDASDVAQEAVLIDVPEVPPIPNVALMFNTTGVDPQYSIDSNIHAVRGSSVTVPVKLNVRPRTCRR